MGIQWIMQVIKHLHVMNKQKQPDSFDRQIFKRISEGSLGLVFSDLRGGLEKLDQIEAYSQVLRLEFQWQFLTHQYYKNEIFLSDYLKELDEVLSKLINLIFTEFIYSERNAKTGLD